MVIKRLSVLLLSFFSVCLFSFGVMAQALDAAWVRAIEQDRPRDLIQQLAQGLDPNSRDSELNPALMLAIQNESWRAYDTLLANRNTDVELANGRQETPMMYLALLGQTERLRDLQQRGGQINRLGWTPLHYAASKGKQDTVRYLLSQQALVNAPAPDGSSPLMMAALSGSRQVVDLLLQAGADVSMQNAQHLKASDWAKSAQHDNLALYLERIEADPLSAYVPASETRTPSTEQSRAPAKTESGGGGSQYFDLDRFEKIDTP